MTKKSEKKHSPKYTGKMADAQEGWQVGDVVQVGAQLTLWNPNPRQD